MTRERYKTTETDVSTEFDRVCRLFQQALPGPSDRLVFECLMNEASSLGLSWVEGLQYVVDKRSRLADSEDQTLSGNDGEHASDGKPDPRG